MPHRIRGDVTVGEAARLLRVSRSQVYRWIAGGVLGSRLAGGRRRIERRELDRFHRATGVPCGYEGRVFTTGQAARLLGVSVRSVIRWVDSGLLPGFRLPGTLVRRVLEHDIRALRPAADRAPRALLVGGEGLDGLAAAWTALGLEVERVSSGIEAGMRVARFPPFLLCVDAERFPEIGVLLREDGAARGTILVAVAPGAEIPAGYDAVLSPGAGAPEAAAILAAHSARSL